MVPGPSAGHEQHAALALQILGMCDGVVPCGSDRRRRRNQALFHADHRDRLELQLFHAVHGANPD